jgi:hypothetical protein
MRIDDRSALFHVKQCASVIDAHFGSSLNDRALSARSELNSSRGCSGISSRRWRSSLKGRALSEFSETKRGPVIG